ncbi:MAG TPA: T9SS type A sorting domain-containing protein, partial [Bacteroidota bacterium]
MAFTNITNNDIITSDSIYYSMLILVDSASIDGTNIVSLSSSVSSEKGALLWLQDGGTGWKFGISKTSTVGALDPVYAAATSTKTDTIIVVVKYGFRTLSSTNDIVELWVNPDLSGTEPAPEVSLTDNGIGDLTDFNFLEFYEQSYAESTYYYIDGVRIAPDWANAPLPVQLSSFAATSTLLGVELQWTTESEVNNYGFEVERRAVGGVAEWSRIGFVQGAGTSSAGRDYSFTDTEVSHGRYAYRVKQIDLNGAFTYYGAMEVEVGIAPQNLALEPNFPNPFNPSTSIAFTVPQDGRATLKVFNVLGQEVAVLFDEEATAGRAYRQTFDASSLPTGVYISRLEFGGQMVMRKMLFVK